MCISSIYVGIFLSSSSMSHVRYTNETWCLQTGHAWTTQITRFSHSHNFSARANKATDDIEVLLPPVEDIDAILGTEKWLVRQAESEALGLNKATQVEMVGLGGHSESFASKEQEGCTSLACGDKSLEQWCCPISPCFAMCKKKWRVFQFIHFKDSVRQWRLCFIYPLPLFFD